ncbi:MAG: hypothetical protein GKR88_17370 [Flavobacteriaceae bacterium]|nr:MAG: hypothetical protein GKR88_17370 [Flavobacteriaceae bacterium]
MERHYRYSDDIYEEKFKSGKFPPLYFSHEAHLRLAYIHIKKYRLEQSIQHMGRQIYHFAIKYGATMKFNATVTYASLQIMNRYMQQSESDHSSDFIKEFPSLSEDFKGIIKQHYSQDIFRSPEAKATILYPDLVPF